MMEEILERELSRVAAPEELWDRVQQPVHPHQRAVAVREWWPWALAAAVMVAAIVSGMRLMPVNADRVAIQAAQEPQQLEFRSAEASEIRSWVRAHSDLDVPLAAGLPPSVRLEGARSMGEDMVEVAYLVDGRRGALVVSKAGFGFGNASHGLVSRNRGTVSWSMRGQRFALACTLPTDLEAACLVCHGDGIPHGS